jgi:hypothetical protein
MRGTHHLQEETSRVPLSSPLAEQAQIVLQVTTLTKRYGDQVALADIALTRQSRRNPRPHWAERRRQDDLAGGACGPSARRFCQPALAR